MDEYEYVEINSIEELYEFIVIIPGLFEPPVRTL